LMPEKDVKDIEIFLGEGSPLDFAGLIKGSGQKQGENFAEIVVNITKKHDRDEPSFFMVQRLRGAIEEQCQKDGANIKMVEPPAGPPVLASVVAEIYGGSTLESREALAYKVADIFHKTEGLVDIDVLSDTEYTTYKLVPNAIKISKSALSVEQVNQILYLAFEGVEVAVENEKNTIAQVPIFVRLKNESREMSENSKKALEKKISELKLMNQQGMMVPLVEVVDIVKASNNKMITSKALRDMINVVAETDMVSQIYPLLDAKSAIEEQLADQYTIEGGDFLNLKLTDKKTGEHFDLKWDGELQVTIDTFIELGGAFIAALVLIFLLMVVYYKSFALSGIVLLGSFLSIIGVIVGHWIMDIFTYSTFFLTATSLIGFIALIGISSRNSLLLIDFAKALINEKGFEKKRAIAVATATRAKPIFLTAGAIILASSLLASDAVFGGLGVALIFGTIAAVVASLIVVPVLMDSADLSK